MTSYHTLFTITTIISFIQSTYTYSKTLYCDDIYCNFGSCGYSEPCTNIKYICTNRAQQCIINCHSGCDNINITSFADNTQIICNKEGACNQVSIHIPIANSRLYLECKNDASCNTINIHCINKNHCECKDNDYEQCYNNVYGEWRPYHAPTEEPTSHPTSNPIATNTNIVILVQQPQTNDTNTGDKLNYMTVIICVGIFWIMLCIAIPFYIRYYSKNKKNEENVDEPHGNNRSGEASHTQMDPDEPMSFTTKGSKTKQSMSLYDACRTTRKSEGNLVLHHAITTKGDDDDVDVGNGNEHNSEYDKLYEGARQVSRRVTALEDDSYENVLNVHKLEPVSLNTVHSALTLALPDSLPHDRYNRGSTNLGLGSQSDDLNLLYGPGEGPTPLAHDKAYL